MATETEIQNYLDFYAAAREFLAKTPIETHRWFCDYNARKAYKNLLQIPESLRNPEINRVISGLESFIDAKRTECFEELAALDGF